MRYALVVLLVGFLALGACDSNKPDAEFFVTAEQNGEFWQIEREINSIVYPTNSILGFSVSGRNWQGTEFCLRPHYCESLSFGIRFYDGEDPVGVYPADTMLFAGGARGGVSFIDYDATVARYQLEEGEDGFVQIDRFDEEARIVEGAFQLTFIKESETDAPGYGPFPETLRFTDGRFRVQYEEWQE